jgi:hypothetical protein
VIARLPNAAVEVLESVYQHRLLTTLQVREMHTPDASRRWTQRLLHALARHQLIDVARGPRTIGVWFVTEQGAEAVEQLPSRLEGRRKLIAPAQAAGQLQAHTLAVNDVGIAYLKAARERGDEFGAFSWRHEIAHAIGSVAGRRAGDQLIADALITYLQTSGEQVSQHQRFLELDRGTLPVEALIEKCRRYQRLRTYTPEPPRGAEPVEAWRAWYPAGLPDVQIVLAGKPRAQLERRLRLLLALYAAAPELHADKRLRVRVVLLEDLQRHGPFAQIWLAAENPSARLDWLAQPATGGRSR